MLAIVFRFLRSSFAGLPRALERYELASIFLDAIGVGAVIGAPVPTTTGRDSRTRNPHPGTKHQ